MARETVEDALRSHRAERQLAKITALEILGDGVVKRPKRAALELVMARVAEFQDAVVNVAGRESLRIHKVDEQIGSLLVGNFDLLVSLNPIAHIIPMADNAAHGISKHAGEIRHDVDSVAASELDIRRKAQIFADQHTIANAHGSGHRLVAAIAEAQHDLAVSAVDLLTLKGEAAEVAETIASERVLLGDDIQTSATDSLASQFDKAGVRNRGERISGIRRADVLKLTEFDFILCNDKAHFIVGLELEAPSAATRER